MTAERVDSRPRSDDRAGAPVVEARSGSDGELGELVTELEAIAVGAVEATREPWDSWEPLPERRPWREGAARRALGVLGEAARAQGRSEADVTRACALAVAGVGAQRSRAVQHAGDTEGERHRYWQIGEGDVVARALSYAYRDPARWRAALYAGASLARRCGGIGAIAALGREVLAEDAA